MISGPTTDVFLVVSGKNLMLKMKEVVESGGGDGSMTACFGEHSRLLQAVNVCSGHSRA